MGLGNTTVGSSMAAGNMRLQQADLNRLAESLAGMKMNIEGTLGSQYAGARASGYGTQYDVESGLAGAQQGLGDWRAQTAYGMGAAHRAENAAMGSRQAREMLDTRNALSGDVENLVYSPSVTAADPSLAYNSIQGMGYGSVPPDKPNWFEQWGAPMTSAAMMPVAWGLGTNWGTGYGGGGAHF